MSSWREYLPDEEEKKYIKKDVVSRILKDTYLKVREDQSYLRRLINETISAEIDRWKMEPEFPLAQKYLSYFRRLRKKLPRLSDSERRSALAHVVGLYMDEIQGHFSPFIYHLATRVVPNSLAILLAGISPMSIISRFPNLPSIDSHVIVEGEKHKIKKLAERGTIMLVPTHVSHMDSPIIGYVVWKLGLPPFLYGAGLNLFSNPILGFFMRNLGAYKVDRKRKHTLYLDTLKTYVSATLEREYDHIFFPEGTRSRSGTFPKKLKMGLLGCGIRSFINNLINKKPRPMIYVVPATFTYHITLEAESLIKQYLEDITREDWVSYHDEAFMIPKIADFIKRFVELDMKVIVRFSDAFDIFGNKVDEEGNSIDPSGRIIDPVKYVVKNGGVQHDPQRDAEFTKELAEKILETYRKDNTVLSTNLTAFVIFELAMKSVGEDDPIRAIKLIDGIELRKDEVIKHIGIAKEKFLELESRGKINVFHRVKEKTEKFILDTAYRVFSKYHRRKTPFFMTAKNVVINNSSLLFYYRNRLSGYLRLI